MPMHSVRSKAGVALVLTALLQSSVAQTCADKVSATQLASYTSSPNSAGDSFGYGVALSGDRSVLVVGAPFRDGRRTDSGAFYVFARGTGTGNYSAQVLTVVTTDGSNTDNGGTGMALTSDGSVIFFGVPLDEVGTSGSNHGSVRIYTKGTGWSYTQSVRLTAADSRSGLNFGLSTALSADGSLLFVGAANAVYSFARQGAAGSTTYTQMWKHVSPLTDTTAAFGCAVAVSGDGSILLVGASYRTSATGTGRVFVYMRVLGLSFRYERVSELIVPGGLAVGAAFGSGVAISANGNEVLAGAAENTGISPGGVGRAGTVHAFTRVPGGASWEYAYVGSFGLTGGAAGDAFAFPALAGDPSIAFVGQPGRSGRGQVTGFTLASCWSVSLPVSTTCAPPASGSGAAPNVTQLPFTISASNPQASEAFGSSVAVSSDGSLMAVGIPFRSPAGSVLLYTRAGGPRTGYYSELTELTPAAGTTGAMYGSGVGLSADGTVLAVGASGLAGTTGGVRLLIRNGTVGNAYLANGSVVGADSTTGDTFGSSVFLNAAATLLVAGAPGSRTGGLNYAGAVYVFTRPSIGVTFSQAAKLTSPDPLTNGGFGSSVAVSGDGSMIAVGEPAPFDSTRTGRVYVFNRGADGSYAMQWTIAPAVPTPGSHFGAAVAFGNDTVLLVGEVTTAAGGTVHVYTRVAFWYYRLAGTFSQSAISSPAAGDLFGSAMAVPGSGDTVLVGSSGKSGANAAQGAVLPFSIATCFTLASTTQSRSATASAAASPSAAPSRSPTISATNTASALSTLSSSRTAAATASPLPSSSGTMTASPSASPLSTFSISMTPDATASSLGTRSASPSSAHTASVSASRTAKSSLSSSNSPAPSRSGGPTSSAAPSRSAIGTASAQASGSAAPTTSAAATISPTPSASASATFVPTPRVTSAVAAALPGGCTLVTGCAQLPASLELRGSALLPYCVSGADVALFASFTTAPILRVDACSEERVVVVFDAAQDAPRWFWWGGRLTAPARGMWAAYPLARVPPGAAPLAALNATAARWGDAIGFTGTGLGQAGVAAVWLRVGAETLPCAGVHRVDDDTVACTLRFVRMTWWERNATVTLEFSSGSNSTWPAPLHMAPSLPLDTSATLLDRNGGTPVQFDLPAPAWVAAEAAAVGWSADISARVGSFATTACTVSAANRRRVVCVTPRGFGTSIPVQVSLGGVLNFTGGAQLDYVPAVPVSITPSFLLVPPANSPRLASSAVLNVTIVFDTGEGVALLANLTVAGIRCSSSFVYNGTSLVCFLGNVSAVAAALGDADSVPLSVSFTWGPRTFFKGGADALGVAVIRPTLTAIAPTSVTPAGALIVFGENFCPSSGCASSGSLLIRVGDHPCGSVTLISPTLGTCQVPQVSPEEPGFPFYTVTVANEVGAIASRQPRVTFPSGAFVRTVSDLATSFVPSDVAEPWPIERDAAFALFPPNAVEPYAGEIECTIVPQTAGVFLSVSAVKSVSIANFGRPAIQARFSTSSVTLSVTCVSTNNDYKDTLPMIWTLAVLPLRTTLCSEPLSATQSQAEMPPLPVKLSVGPPPANICASNRPWTGPPLPPIACTVAFAEPSGDASLQNSFVLVDANATATFGRLMLGGEVFRTYSLSLSCSIGSLRIPPGHGWMTRVTGCSPGAEPVGVLCKPCPSNAYSDGGSAVCRRCPRLASCDRGVLSLPANVFRPSNEAEAPLDGDSELFSCALPTGCYVNESSRAFGCNTGYTGMLCGVCDVKNGFARISDECVPCLDRNSNRAIMAIAVLTAVAFIAFAVLRKAPTGRAAKVESTGTFSTGWRIFLSHMQAVASLRGFKANGGALFRKLMGFVAIFSPAAISQGPAQCLVNPSYALVFFTTLVLPLMAVGVALAVMTITDAIQAFKQAKHTREGSWWSLYRQQTQRNVEDGRHITVLSLTAHLAYMPIISVAIAVFKCSQPIVGTRYLLADLREPCSGSKYVFFGLTAAAVLVIFGLGFPLAVYRRLSQADAATLRYPLFMQAWGFLYTGFRFEDDSGKAVRAATLTLGKGEVPKLGGNAEPPKPEPAPAKGKLFGRAESWSKAAIAASGIKGKGAAVAAPAAKPEPVASPARGRRAVNLVWWEAVVLLRKLGVVVIESVLLYVDETGTTQAVAFVLWQVVFLAIHARFWPYIARLYNAAETVSLAVCVLTACLNLLVPAGSVDTEGAALGITLFLILANLLTFVGLLAITLRPWCVYIYMQCRDRKKRRKGGSELVTGGGGMSGGGGGGPGSGEWVSMASPIMGPGSSGMAARISIASGKAKPLGPAARFTANPVLVGGAVKEGV